MEKRVQWVCLDAHFCSDAKMQQIRTERDGDKMALLWVFLICRAGLCNDGGRVYVSEGVPYTAKSLAKEFGFSAKFCERSLQVFEKFSLISYENGTIFLNNFSKWQHLDKLKTRRENDAKRQVRYRERHSAEAAAASEDVTLRNVSHNVTVTPYKTIDNTEHNNTETDAQKPTLAAVSDYFRQKGYLTDPERFVSLNDARGWVVSGSPVKDWKALADSWARNERVSKLSTMDTTRTKPCPLCAQEGYRTKLSMETGTGKYSCPHGHVFAKQDFEMI